MNRHAKTTMLPFMPLEAYKEINSLNKLNNAILQQKLQTYGQGTENIYTTFLEMYMYLEHHQLQKKKSYNCLFGYMFSVT